MTMRNGCTVQCTCMTTRNADQTRPDQTRPDPFFSYLCASNRFLTASTTEGANELVEKRNDKGMPPGIATVRRALAATRPTDTNQEQP